MLIRQWPIIIIIIRPFDAQNYVLGFSHVLQFGHLAFTLITQFVQEKTTSYYTMVGSTYHKDPDLSAKDHELNNHLKWKAIAE